MVQLPRLERGTPRSTIWCSNQLSYSCPCERGRKLVPPRQEFKPKGEGPPAAAGAMPRRPRGRLQPSLESPSVIALQTLAPVCVAVRPAMPAMSLTRADVLSNRRRARLAFSSTASVNVRTDPAALMKSKVASACSRHARNSCSRISCIPAEAANAPVSSPAATRAADPRNISMVLLAGCRPATAARAGGVTGSAETGVERAARPADFPSAALIADGFRTGSALEPDRAMTGLDDGPFPVASEAFEPEDATAFDEAEDTGATRPGARARPGADGRNGAFFRKGCEPLGPAFSGPEDTPAAAAFAIGSESSCVAEGARFRRGSAFGGTGAGRTRSIGTIGVEGFAFIGEAGDAGAADFVEATAFSDEVEPSPEVPGVLSDLSFIGISPSPADASRGRGSFPKTRLRRREAAEGTRSPGDAENRLRIVNGRPPERFGALPLTCDGSLPRRPSALRQWPSRRSSSHRRQLSAPTPARPCRLPASGSAERTSGTS
jgi:hypothetical protein